MIILKFIIYILIFLCATSIGVLFSKKYKDRVNELKQMKIGLEIFRTKIKFTYEPIPDIFEEISKKLKQNTSVIFEIASRKMKNKTAKLAWEEALEQTNISITKEDKDILKTLGALLGTIDVKGQISQIELTNSFLLTQINKAEIEREKNEKLYNILGAICGLGIVIILM